MSNITIDQIIPEGPLRQQVYRVFAALGFAAFAAQAGFLAIPESEVPVWLRVSLAVVNFAGAAGFLKAQANVPTSGAAVVSTEESDGAAG